MKQTAVEFLQESLSIHLSHQQQMQFEGLFQQAKEMEKEQIIAANIAGMEFIPVDPNRHQEDAEQYYNETFKTKER